MLAKKNVLLIILIGLFIIPVPVFSQTEEYTMKAVYLERFSRFVTWPDESTIKDTTQPFIISVIGENPFGEILEKIFSSQKILKKPVKIKYISKISEISDSHILFISKSSEKEILKILSYTKNKPILTISDSKDYAKKGVLINFYVSSGKLRFEINIKAVKESKLSMSYLLLQIAKIIE